MASSIADALLAALLATGTQLAWVLGPAAACALVLHQLQRMLSATLVGTFGWRAALLTGWIGVPVHELSHVAACLVFMHEVDEVKLFSPDPETGTLGVVRHHAPAGNPWAAIGRLFIGLAPILGGAFALLLAAHLWLPAAGLSGLGSVGSLDGPSGAFERAWSAAGALLDPRHLAEPRAWIVLYVVICVAAHMAPSRDDLGGAIRGGVALVATLLVVNLVAGAFGGIPLEHVRQAAGYTIPVVAALTVAVILSAFALAAALSLTAVVERFRGGRGHLRRFLTMHWARIAVGAATATAFVLVARG